MSRPPGRRPKPTALHKLHGTHNATRHKHRETEPEAAGLLEEPPDFLTEGQKEAWRYAIEHAPLGILRKIDRGALLLWVEAEDRHRQALIMQAKVDTSAPLPLLTKAKDGTAIPSPYLRIMNQAADVMLRTASELGFTPASRPRLAAKTAQGVPAEPNSPWAKLRVLQGGKS